MNKRLTAVLVNLPVLHALSFLLIRDVKTLFLTVVCLDIASGILFLLLRKRLFAPVHPVPEAGMVFNESEVKSMDEQAVGLPAVPGAQKQEIERQTGKIMDVLYGCLDCIRKAAASENERSLNSVQLLKDLQETINPLQKLTRLIYENIHQAHEIASNLSGSAEQAFNLSHRVQSEVETMSDELQNSLSETENLLEESRKISDILEIMTDLSANIHVLSINASIVAARAGIYGKAFDVVAKEVGKLSEKTKLSLKDIEKLLTSIQGKVQSVAGKINNVNTGIINEKASLLSVAGSLQGLMLAVGVIQTVSSLSSQKALEEQKNVNEMMEKVRSAVSGLESGKDHTQAESFKENLLKVISELSSTKS